MDLVSVMANPEMKDDLLVVLDEHKSNVDIWILDPTCSHHYISNRSLFATYTKTKEV